MFQVLDDEERYRAEEVRQLLDEQEAYDEEATC